MHDETVAAAAHELYTLRDHAACEALFAQRSAGEDAAFFLPYLRPGLRMLDCGSGPGSLTCDLAAVVAPGEVIGVDIQAAQVDRARTLARERGVAGARFAVGSIYALPFVDASFDGAFAHMLLMHLRNPLRALRELRRVLKPGGVVGIADNHWGVWHFYPSTPRLTAMQALRIRAFQFRGGSPFYAGEQRELLLRAGFVRAEASAAFEAQGAGSLAKTRQLVSLHAAALRSPAFMRTVVGQGWASQAEIDAMHEEVLAWGERPDAFLLLTRCTAVGWNAA
jgi:SAM-dependent methyltransferase